MDSQGKKPYAKKKKYHPKRPNPTQQSPSQPAQRSQQFRPPSQSFQDPLYPIYHTNPFMPIQVSPGTFRLPPEQPPRDIFSRYREPNEPYYNPPYRNPVPQDRELVDEEHEQLEDEAYDDVNDTESEDEEGEEPANEVGKQPTSSSRAKPIPWTPEDEECLAKAYFHISTDPKVGDFQKHDSFYGRVTKHYHTLQKKHTRTIHQIHTKWKNMKPRLKEFNGIFANLKHVWGSGRDDADILKMALDKWAERHKNKPFQHLKAWDIAHLQEKFNYVPPVGGIAGESDSGGSEKRARTSESGNYQCSVPDLNEDSMPTLPTRKGKNKVDSRKSKSELHESIEEYKALKIKETEERKQREEKKMEVFLERENLTREMLVKQLELQNQAQMDRDLKLYVEPHDHLPPPVRDIMFQRKREIAEKYNWPAPNP